MKILIVNDDGVFAAGIRALVEVLAPHYEVYVVAPTRERSAMGHALTLFRPLRVEELPENYFAGAKAVYTVDGTPTDCAKIALTKILNFKPDLVISGINHGPNMGVDIIYSGTVSIAMEGTLYGIRSLAFSLNDNKVLHFEEDAKVIPDIVNMLVSNDDLWESNTFFNINLPALKNIGEPKGMKFTTLGNRMYADDYDERIDPRGRKYYWLSGELQTSDKDPSSDIVACENGYISITPISLDLLNKPVLDKLLK